MRASTAHKSSVAATTILLLQLAAAHPHSMIDLNGCKSAASGKIASTISCGQPEDIQSCIAHFGLDASQLETCLLEAGCGWDEAEAEADWAAERCQEDSGFVDEEEYVVELREVELRRRDDTTTTTATSSTSTTSASSTSSSTATSTTETSASTTATSSATSSTSSSSSSGTATSSSTSSSSTSSSTASSTSSSASATSTSSSSSSSGVPKIGYFVAALLALFAAGCIGGICLSCCAERRQRKAATKAADAKEAMMQQT